MDRHLRMITQLSTAMAQSARLPSHWFVLADLARSARDLMPLRNQVTPYGELVALPSVDC